MMLAEIGLQTVSVLSLAAPITWGLANNINRLWSEAWFEQSTFVSPVLASTVAACVFGLSVLAVAWVFAQAWRGGLLENLRARGLQ